MVNHMTFELRASPVDGASFALIAGEALKARDRKPLFIAPISSGMAEELRAVADAIEPLEPKGEEL